MQIKSKAVIFSCIVVNYFSEFMKFPLRTFQNNFPPEGGICGVTPEAVSGSEQATANCVDWKDEDGVGSYTFYSK